MFVKEKTKKTIKSARPFLWSSAVGFELARVDAYWRLVGLSLTKCDLKSTYHHVLEKHGRQK